MLQRILAFDEAVLVSAQRWRPCLVTRVMRALTVLGDASTWALVSSVLVLQGGTARHTGLLMGASALVAALLAQTLKRICRRKRPSTGIRGFLALAENPDVFSFPSGHTAAATAVAIALSSGGPHGPPYVALAIGVGISRVYLGAHYPLDVTAGALLGCLAGVLTRLFLW